MNNDDQEQRGIGVVKKLTSVGKFLFLFGEFLTAAIVGTLLYFPLKNPDLAKLTWAAGLLFMVASLKHARQLKEEMAAINVMRDVLDLSSRCDVQRVRDILDYYMKVDSKFFGPLKNDIIDTCMEALRKLASDKTSEPISGAQYYAWLIGMLSQCRSGDKVLAVSTMDESAWLQVAPERNYLQRNIEAARKRVHIERIFITTRDRLANGSLSNVLGYYVSNRHMDAYIAFCDEISLHDSQLAREVGPGFVIFNNDVVMIDSSVPPGLAAGRVSIEPILLKRYNEVYRRLLIYAHPIKAKTLASLSSNASRPVLEATPVDTKTVPHIAAQAPSAARCFNGARLTYLPWSKGTLEDCLRAYRASMLPTLDIELTAKCSFVSCIYCDSKPAVGNQNPNELTRPEIERVVKEARQNGLRWIYSCGLGEPMEDEKLQSMIDLSSSLGIRVSLFTNAIAIDPATAKWLHDRKVCLVVKLDSLDADRFDSILGVTGAAKKIYTGIDNLLQAGYGIEMGTSCSDIAFSIVPTTINIQDIPDVIKYALQCNAFPSVGELEQAGRVMDAAGHTRLAVIGESLSSLKKNIEQLLWTGYTRPVCPTIITGLHIDSIGNCVVDKDTGLNCKWFMLKEPSVNVVGNIRNTPLAELYEKAKAYRSKSFDENPDAIRNCRETHYMFGGCGGSPSEVIQLAKHNLIRSSLG